MAAAHRRRGPSCAAILLAMLTACIVSLGTYRIVIIDDAYITFRMARNLASGVGYVYNAGESVEASTSLTWPLLLSVFYTFTSAVPEIASALGALFAALALVVAFQALQDFGCSGGAAVVGVALVGIMPPYWLAAAAGLEGGLYSLLLALNVALFRDRRHAAAIVGGLLFATRPEGAAVFAILWGLKLLHRWCSNRSDKADHGPHWTPLMVWLAIVGGITAWRLLAFGSPLPNSVIAKSVPITTEILAMGATYLADFATAFPHWVAALAVGALFCRRDLRVAAAVIIVCVQAPVILRNGGDWIPQFRLIVQYGPLFAIVGGVAIDGLLNAVDRRFYAGAVLAALFGATLISINRLGPALAPLRRVSVGVGIDLPSWGYSSLATALRPVLQPSDVIAPEAIGRIGMELPDTKIHDFLGLSDATIAWHGTQPAAPYGKTDLVHSLKQRPMMFVFHSGDYYPRKINAATGDGLDREYTRLDLNHMDVRVYVLNGEMPRFRAALGGSQ
jgi:arabinofuranosyltransferase